MAVEDSENRLSARLHQNYPNPFNPTTSISYFLDRSGRVNLSVYNAAGQLVSTLVDSYQKAGPHIMNWNGDDSRGQKVSSGIYFYRLSAGTETITRKAVLLR